MTTQLQKQCSNCKEWKPATTEHFSPQSNARYGLHSHCKACKRQAARERNAGKPPKIRIGSKPLSWQYPKKVREVTLPTGEQFKRCNRCNNWFTLEQLGINPKGQPNLSCCACREYMRQKQAIRAERKRLNLPPKPPRPPKVLKPKVVKEPRAPLVLQPELELNIQAFLNVKSMKKWATWDYYKRSLMYFSRYLVEHNYPQWPPDPDAVNGFLAEGKKRGLKDGTLDVYYRAIVAWFNFLAKRKKIDRDLVELIERPSKSKSLPKVAKVEDIVKLLGTLKAARTEKWQSLRDWALITVALDTGARIGEINSLNLDRVNLEQCTFLLTATKTGEDRTVTFSDQAAEALGEWLKERAMLDCPSELKAVFISWTARRRWTRFSPSGIRQKLEIWQDKAGIERFNFHRLRATYAVYTLRNGGDLLDVQKQMGHNNLSTTQIYTRVDDSGRRQRHNKANPLNYLGGVS